jgi:ABC-type transport system involved in multi-copper enzyme maturation permease subunit
MPAAAEERFQTVDVERRSFPLHAVSVVNKGVRANLRKLLAATTVELTLLRHERSLIVLLPLSILISFLSLPFSLTGVGGSAVFAARSVRGLSLFLLGMIVFYVGEAMHRDQDARIEPVLWSTPIHNNVLLLSKFFAVLLLSVLLLILGGLTAMLTQVLRGQAPVDVSAYVIIYTVILVPSLAFMAAASLALNVFLRDKYLCYAVTIATGSALLYLYSQGFNHWLYNPVLYGLWTESDFASWDRLSYLIWLRVYCLAIGVIGLVAAHVFFERRSD